MAKRRTKRSSHSKTRRAPRTKKAVVTARRRRKKRGLSESFSKSNVKGAVMSMGMGAVGGLATAVLEKAVGKFAPASMGKAASVAVVLAGSFVAHSMLKKPEIASGMAGALGYSLSKSIPGLNDDADFADEDALYDDAPYMDEYGNPMDEDGNYLLNPGMDDGYLDDGYLDDDDAYLSGNYDQGWPVYSG